MVKKNKIQTLLDLTTVDIKPSRDHWSKYFRKDLAIIGERFSCILFFDDPFKTLSDLGKTDFFEIFIPELAALKKIPQNKQSSSNAFHHSLTVASQIKNEPLLRWAGLLHDIGKAHYRTNPHGGYDFRGHEFNGAKLAKGILKRMKIPNSGEIYKLIQFHTHPLDYQRQPNWKMATVKRFVEKYEHLSQPLIDLAIADKIASSNKADYLEELYKLKQMVEEIQYEPKRV